MRGVLIGLAGLLLGALAALGYSHYLGEGRQLAQAETDLSQARADAAKTAEHVADTDKQNQALSAQVQQLIATKDDLKQKLAAASAAPAPAATPAFPGIAPGTMSKIVSDQVAQQQKTRLRLLETRLHLTPEQVAAVEAAMDAEGKRTQALAAKMLGGGKVDPQDLMKDIGSVKSVDQVLNDILTPDQKTAYQQVQTEQKNNAAEMMASTQLNQVESLAQLNDAQKDQVYNALYQVQMDSEDPNWVKANVGNGTDPTAFLDAQEKAKEAALGKILTPDQLAAYQEQMQGQLAMQKAMMKNFAPPGDVSVHMISTPAQVAPGQ
ncbi:MAG: hypothetical protein WDO13_15340 [Verrucomicrobiota bacterium]